MDIKFDSILGAFREVDAGGAGSAVTVDSQITQTSSNPVTSRAIHTALSNKLSVAYLGVPNGVATLDADGKLSASQMPHGVGQASNVCKVLFEEKEWELDDLGCVFVYAGLNNQWLQTGHIYRVDSFDNSIDINDTGLCISFGGDNCLYDISGVSGEDVRRAVYSGSYMNNPATLSYNETNGRWELVSGNEVVLYHEGNSYNVCLSPEEISNWMWRYANGYQPELSGVSVQRLQYSAFEVSGISANNGNGIYTLTKCNGTTIEFTGNKVTGSPNYWTLTYKRFSNNYAWTLNNGYWNSNCQVDLNGPINSSTVINEDYLNGLNWYCDEDNIGTPSFAGVGLPLGKYRDVDIKYISTDITPNISN